MGDPTLADAILDRLTHNAHRIELRGDSMRRDDAADTPQTVAITPMPTARRRNAPLGGLRGAMSGGDGIHVVVS